MLLYFDESGDFAYPDDRFDAYTQAVLICADSKLANIEEYLEGRKAAWGVEELHATELDDARVFDVCRFIRAERLPLLAQATDTNGLSQRIIERHRLDQAARIQRNYDAWREAGGDAEAIAAWYEASIKRAAYPSRPNNGEWVQSDLLIELIHQALNKAVVAHLDDRWRDDFRDFRFIFDGKLTGKLAADEKQLQRILLPALGSNPERFSVLGANEWRDPPIHPWAEKYSTESGDVDLGMLFEHGWSSSLRTFMQGSNSSTLSPTSRDAGSSRPRTRRSGGRGRQSGPYSCTPTGSPSVSTRTASKGRRSYRLTTLATRTCEPPSPLAAAQPRGRPHGQVRDPPRLQKYGQSRQGALRPRVRIRRRALLAAGGARPAWL